jgi:hypothetical protein
MTMPALAGPVPEARGFYAWRGGAWEPTDWVGVGHVAGSALARLLEDIACRHPDGRLTVSRKGMLFDGGSKPDFTWPLIGHPWSDYLLAYVDHDGQCIDAQDAFMAGEIDREEYSRRLRRGDRDFLANQLWIKRVLLGKAGNRWERMVVRVKFRTVRLHARWRVWRDARDREA